MKKILLIGTIIIVVVLSLALFSGCGNKEIANNSSSNVAEVNGNVQTVTTKITSSSYAPITVQKGIPVEWTVQAEQSDITGCNREMISRDFGFDVGLKAGNNLVEFTPEQTGTFTYTCWMGMIKSKITVVDDLSKLSADSINTAVQSTAVKSMSNTNLNNQSAAVNTSALDSVTKAAVIGKTQTVSTDLSGGVYHPIIVQKGIPVKWTVNANSSDITNCNQEMFSRDFGFDVKFKPGSNIVEFTPDQTGTFIYTCWMGMVPGTVTVVDDLNNISPDDIAGYQNAANNYISGGCSMGGGCCGW